MPITEFGGNKIVARKPKDELCEYIVVDRGPGHYHQFVSATATEHSLSHGEWFLGHYFKTQGEALHHFNER